MEFKRPQDLVEASLLQQRTVLLWGEVNDDSARHVVERLLYLESLKPQSPITLLINSPGGHVHAGFTIYDCMQSISSPVATHCTGMAASMGAILLSAGEKGMRKVYPHARVMIHQPSGGIGGRYADIEIQLEELSKAKKLGAQILADNCGQTIDRILADFDRDHWMDAEEALAYGIVDLL
ncbi:MAG: ATP-dependent Clp protease proteolytic subunit [Bacteroidetes bacterium]|nr:MAG: ATP-dependent Clp protease proteolytic subunit [Bacteroidota bacterium]